MLAKTKGFESGQNVEIYNNQVIINSGDIELAKRQKLPKDEIPKPEVRNIVYIKAGTPQGKSSYEGPLREIHHKTFKKTVEAFEAGLERADSDGIPLEELRDVAEGILDVYKQAGINFLEELLDINDSDIEHFPMGHQLREQASDIIAIMERKETEENTEEISEIKETLVAMDQKLTDVTKKADDQETENADLKKQLEAANRALEEANKGKVDGDGKTKEAGEDGKGEEAKTEGKGEEAKGDGKKPKKAATAK